MSRDPRPARRNSRARRNQAGGWLFHVRVFGRGDRTTTPEYWDRWAANLAAAKGAPRGKGGSVRARCPSILIHRSSSLRSTHLRGGSITHGPLEGTASRAPPRARYVWDGLSRAKYTVWTRA